MCFLRFTVAYNHIVMSQQDICDITLSAFVIYMALSGKHKSIRTYLSMGPRIIVENMGIRFKKPSERPILRRVLMSIDRVWGKTVNRKAPITVDNLKAMAKCVNTRSPQVRQTVWAAILLAFFSLVRKSAYCAEKKGKFDPIRQLTVGDLTVVDNRARITLQLTKTLQFAERDLQIILPLLHNEICPTTEIAKMLKLRKVRTKSDPLFVIDSNNTPLTAAVFNKEFKQLLKEAGINTDDKAPHSLRRGGATSALEAGCNPTCIKVQGDWLSDAYLIYIWVTDSLKKQVINCWESALAN